MNGKQNQLSLVVFNIIGFLGTVIVNGLATTLPLNNKSTGELSDQYPNLFVPAGLTFSVWGLIYILLAVFVIFQILAAVRNDTGLMPAYRKVGALFLVTSLFNMAWIFAWHYELVGLSVIIMLLLLGSLLSIYSRLGIGKSTASRKEQYLVHLPFSVYLGWITIATIANITAWLVDINWSRFGLSEQFWAVLLVIVGIVITMAMLTRRGDIFYSLIADWALLGILLKRMAASPAIQSVILVTIIGLALITLGIIIQIVRRKVYVSRTEE